MKPELEQRYRAAIAELAMSLAVARLGPSAAGDIVTGTALEIKVSIYQRHHLPVLQTGEAKEGSNGE